MTKRAARLQRTKMRIDFATWKVSSTNCHFFPRGETLILPLYFCVMLSEDDFLSYFYLLFLKRIFVPSDIAFLSLGEVDMEHILHFIAYLGLIMSLPCLYLSYFIYVKKIVHLEQLRSRICKESFSQFTVRTLTIFSDKEGSTNVVKLYKKIFKPHPLQSLLLYW